MKKKLLATLLCAALTVTTLAGCGGGNSSSESSGTQAEKTETEAVQTESATDNSGSEEEVEIYILDFGSETMKIFKDSPHVGDVLFANEAEKIARFIMMLRKELKDRKQILSDYNVDYNLYKKKTNKVMPTIVVILNNYEVFSENYADTYYYSVFVLGRDLLKDILPYEDDLAYEFCKKVAVDFEESNYNDSSKGLYECLEEYVKDKFYLKNGKITWKGEDIQ